jgi:hypothetical protein
MPRRRTPPYQGSRFEGSVLALLVVAFIVVLFLGIGNGHSAHVPDGDVVLDRKGVLAGWGTLFYLLVAALAALIVVVAFRYYSTMSRPIIYRERTQRYRHWLESVVAKDRRFATPGCELRFDEAGALELSIPVHAPYSLRVWRAASRRVAPADNPYRAGDPEFDRSFDWQTEAPERVAPLLIHKRMTDALMFLATAAIDNRDASALRFEVSTGHARVRLSPMTIHNDEWSGVCALAALDSLVFVARSLDNPAYVAVELSKEELGKGPACRAFTRSEIRWAWLRAVTVSLIVLLIPVAVVIGVGYYFGMGAGMICFFFPFLVAAFFSFTRPSEAEEARARLRTECDSRANAIVATQLGLHELRMKMLRGFN